MPSTKHIGLPILARADHAPCWGCGGVVQRRAQETPGDHARRKTCSLECALAVRVTSNARWAEVWADLEAMREPCVVCGKKFSHITDHESRSRYLARSTCRASECVRQAKRVGAGQRPRQPDPDEAPTDLVQINFGDGFRLNQIVDHERGCYQRFAPAADASTLGGVSAAWAVAR